MQENIAAIYENGVIKPLQKVHLKEHERLTITISKKTAKAKKTALALVGIFDSGIKDLSMKHDEYLYGLKKVK